MKGSSNFGDTQSLGEHTLGSHMFLSKAENHCVIVLILKKTLGLGRAINSPTCKSVTEDYGIEKYMVRPMGCQILKQQYVQAYTYHDLGE